MVRRASLQDLDDSTDRWAVVVRVFRKWNVYQKSAPEELFCVSMVLIDEELSCRFWPHLNYGDFIFDRKDILSSVYLDEETLHGWKKLPIPFHNLNEFPTPNHITQFAFSTFSRMSTGEDQGYSFGENTACAPAIKDTFISFDKWGKGIAFVNEFNLGRYWPSKGPQRNLYVPAPLLKEGDNTLVIFELESPNPELVVHSVNEPDFTCGSTSSQR
ncbi:hypothetical protein K1719_043995 [Acacia pycnantha]|nr:hypothetical protein K1719_043995 [Acacia pycnantha]